MDTGNDAVLAIRYEDPDHESAIVVLNNLSPNRQSIRLDLTEREIATTTELLADRRYDPLDPKTQRLRLSGFGFRWLRLGGVY
jgi:maltose alpha-D-glucosyltransferase / alpha-amylase